MREISDNTRIIDLTVGELKTLIKSTMDSSVDTKHQEPISKPTLELRYGIAGLAQLLGCSKRYAQELKSKGVFDGAITQVGRLITIYPDKALEKWNSMNQLK